MGSPAWAWTFELRDCTDGQFNCKNTTIYDSNPKPQAIAPQQTASPAQTAFNQAVTALDRQDYPTAFALFKPLAEQGDAVAQFNLGVMYAEGQGVAQDFQQARYWFQKAAAQGNANAKAALQKFQQMGK